MSKLDNKFSKFNHNIYLHFYSYLQKFL